ncbi:MAG TPA: hypothetical protein VFY24_03315 [Azospira sp.]|nr:hypothetical protein [Azospira sp.]
MLEILAWFFVNVVLVGVFYWPGWIVLRVVTLGRYPPPRGSKHDPEFVAAVGVAARVTVLLVVYS